ncbi:MAG: hypothetical protein M8857_01460 [marine benthic group bacterium]|nr:hypothetical protein [Gemmatimonadota bacterium]
MELSEGQRQRFDLAYLAQSAGDYLVVDEFLAGLDRLTARAVAWSFSKHLRRLGKGAVLITAHDDLAEHLQPDVWIQTDWTPKPQVIHCGWDDRDPPLFEELEYSRGDTLDWKRLKHLHYAAGDPATYHSVHVLRHPAISTPAAVAVFSYPDLHSSARNLATDDGYRINGSGPRARRLNRDILRLSRIVVAPELRSVGLARLLLGKAIPTLGVAWVEATASMARYTKFLEAAGFRHVPQGSSAMEAELLDWAAQVGLPPQMALSVEQFRGWVDDLSVRKRREGLRAIWLYYFHYVLHRRTRGRRPRRIPDQSDPRWTEAFDLAVRRIHDRPDYYVHGPLRTATPPPLEPHSGPQDTCPKDC